MALPRIGHFGLPAVLLALLPLIALIVHASAPFIVLSENGETNEFTATETEDAFGDSELGPAASPNLILAGLIVATVAGFGLLVFGFTPLPKEAVRWIGWGTIAVAFVGLGMAFHTSMLWTGSGLGLPHPEAFEGGAQAADQSFEYTIPGWGGGSPQTFQFTMPMFFWSMTGGFTGVLESMAGTDHGTSVWVVSPAITALFTAAALVLGLVAISGLISTKGDARHDASRHLGVSLLGIGILLVTMLVPWSIGELTDSEGAGDQDYFFFGARTILAAEDVSDGESFSGLAYTINVLMATGWTAFAAGILGSLGGLLRSSGVSAASARHLDWAVIPALVLGFWSAMAYVVYWTYQWRPFSGADGWQPGWFPILLLPLFVLLGWQMVRIARGLQIPQDAGQGRAFHSFD